MTVLTNFLLFQLGWFACVLGAAYGLPFVGTSVAVVIVVAHVSRVAQRRKELGLLLIAATIGAAWDSALIMLGLIAYPNGMIIAGLAPVWILALWMLFATTLNVTLRWMHRRLVVGALFGALGGPLAYYAGAKLNALTLLDAPLALAAQAVGWAVLMPMLLSLARRFDGVKQPLRGIEPCLT